MFLFAVWEEEYTGPGVVFSLAWKPEYKEGLPKQTFDYYSDKDIENISILDSPIIFLYLCLCLQVVPGMIGMLCNYDNKWPGNS